MADQVAEVKNKTDIVTLIGSFIDLRKAGRNYKANCPFHGEKTPSFMVSPELQMYKCFGCDEKGDVFTFLERFEGMDFSEALKFLAEKAGVQLKQSDFKDAGIKSRLLELHKWAAKFYTYILTKHPLGKKALLYSYKDRGIISETLKTFDLGFAPENSKLLMDFLTKKKKFTPFEIEKSGIMYKGYSGEFVDRFRGRLIFPLKDHLGAVVGFAGRLMPGGSKESAKYINSPETEIYHKSRLLYSLSLTKEAIKSQKSCVVVEGEIDLISCFQNGVKNIVAIKGSAFTSDQAKLISRFTDRVILFLDSDFAGDKAAQRGISTAEDAGLTVFVARIPEEKRGQYKDPDDVARKDPELLKQILSETVGAWDFVFDSIFSKYDVSSGVDKAKLARELPTALAEIKNTIVQAHYVQKLAKKLDIEPVMLERMIPIDGKPISKASEKITVNPKVITNRKTLLEEQLVFSLLMFDPKKLKDKDMTELISTPFLSAFLAFFQNYPLQKFNIQKLSEELPANLQEKFTGIILSEGEENENTITRAYIENLVKELTIINTQFKLQQITGKIRMFEDQKDQESLKKAEKTFIVLTKKLSKLKNS